MSNGEVLIICCFGILLASMFLILCINCSKLVKLTDEVYKYRADVSNSSDNVYYIRIDKETANYLVEKLGYHIVSKISFRLMQSTLHNRFDLFVISFDKHEAYQIYNFIINAGNSADIYIRRPDYYV